MNRSSMITDINWQDSSVHPIARPTTSHLAVTPGNPYRISSPTEPNKSNPGCTSPEESIQPKDHLMYGLSMIGTVLVGLIGVA